VLGAEGGAGQHVNVNDDVDCKIDVLDGMHGTSTTAAAICQTLLLHRIVSECVVREREGDSGSLPNGCRNVAIHVTKPPSVGKYQPLPVLYCFFGNRAGRALVISISLSISPSPCPSLPRPGTCCSDADTDTDSDHDGPVEHGRGRAPIRIDWILAFLQPGDITKLCMTVSRAVVWGWLTTLSGIAEWWIGVAARV
jgi:hypothetical protein